MQCFLGASITTISRMTRKSASKAEENRRRKCVSEAFEKTNSQGIQYLAQKFDCESFTNLSILAGKINPLDPNFSLTFSRKTEYIFLSYVSIEELFRK